MKPNIMIIAGEPSGDMHAAQLVDALRARGIDANFWGIGGEELQKRGVELLQHVRDMAVMGIVEVLRNYRFFRAVLQQMVCEVQLRRPDLVILIDYPGFNLRLAQAIKPIGSKVVYYICPQVWAWHRSRVKKIASVVKRLLVIFPFEVGLFSKTGLAVDYVGHPLVPEICRIRREPILPLPWDSSLRIAILPGSREQEVRRILPTLLRAASLIESQFEQSCFIVAAANDEMAMLITQTLKRVRHKPNRIKIVIGMARQILRQARAAWVTSGTATLEAALLGCPMVVVYKTSWLNYLLGRMLIRVPYIGMVNVLARTQLCQELIQGEAKPNQLAQSLSTLLSDSAEYNEMTMGFNQIARYLGNENAASKAAEIVAQELGQTSIAQPQECCQKQ